MHRLLGLDCSSSLPHPNADPIVRGQGYSADLGCISPGHSLNLASIDAVDCEVVHSCRLRNTPEGHPSLVEVGNVVPRLRGVEYLTFALMLVVGHDLPILQVSLPTSITAALVYVIAVRITVLPVWSTGAVDYLGTSDLTRHWC